MTFAPRVLPFGERALLVELGEAFDERAIEWSRAIADAWESARLGGAIPAYASTVLTFDPEALAPAEAERNARRIVDAGPAIGGGIAGRAPSPDIIEIATRYDGPDLSDVARLSGLSVDELVALHSGRTYTVYFLGFLPGFAYCGRLDPRIAAPRLGRPRERVAAGTVAVADGQTGVYPSPSPGGWRLIGTTDLVLFDPAGDPPARLRPGDRLRFVPA